MIATRMSSDTPGGLGMSSNCLLILISSPAGHVISSVPGHGPTAAGTNVKRVGVPEPRFGCAASLGRLWMSAVSFSRSAPGQRREPDTARGR
eukprot:2561541-Prymnesium_polylepis.1